MQVNPAGEAINGALPRMPAVKAHFRSLPYQHIASALRTVEGSNASLAARYAMRFLVLTATRSGEVREACWSELLKSLAWQRAKGPAVLLHQLIKLVEVRPGQR